MPSKRVFRERDLAALAKRFRTRAGKTRAQAARDMGVAQPSIFHAEESPHLSLVRLRVRMIEAYSPFTVVGALFILKKTSEKRAPGRSMIARISVSKLDSKDKVSFR